MGHSCSILQSALFYRTQLQSITVRPILPDTAAVYYCPSYLTGHSCSLLQSALF